MPGSVRYLFSKKGKLKVSPQHIAWGAPAALPDTFEIVHLHSSIVNCFFASANAILKQVQNDGLRLVAKSISEPTRQLDRFTAPSLLREGRGGLPFSFKIGCSVLANPTLLKSFICILQSLIAVLPQPTRF
jgi:hypothetical protein